MSLRNLHKIRDLQTEDFHHVSVIPISAYIAYMTAFYTESSDNRLVLKKTC